MNTQPACIVMIDYTKLTSRNTESCRIVNNCRVISVTAEHCISTSISYQNEQHSSNHSNSEMQYNNLRELQPDKRRIIYYKKLSIEKLSANIFARKSVRYIYTNLADIIILPGRCKNGGEKEGAGSLGNIMN